MVLFRDFLYSVYNVIFNTFQAMGVHILPKHYAFPIPDTRKLSSKHWEESNMVGVDLNEKEQVQLLELFKKKYSEEYNKIPVDYDSSLKKDNYYLKNRQFSTVDAEVYYSMIRHYRPKRIIEIGSGHSTRLAIEAIHKNSSGGADCTFTAIEPYPNKDLHEIITPPHELHVMNVENIDYSFFDQLEDNDFLFIDSSHVLKIGSDVKYEFLEILPRLNRNVIIHIHDIFLPYEYPQSWILKKQFFWNEQYLLNAFLCFNSSFKVLWAGSYMYYKNSDLLKKAFRSLAEIDARPSSFWIQKVV